MSKKVLILSGSPRKGGNSDSLCQQFAAGAKEAGHTVETIRIAEKKIGFCTGCYACAKTGKCFQNDDADAIIEKMMNADVLVLATPVYFYTMCAQLKVLIDRTVAVYPRITNKTFYYVMTMGDGNESMITGTLEALRGFQACCEGSTEAGILCGAGAYDKDDVKKMPVWEKARQMGKDLK